MSIDLVMPSNRLILCCPLLLLPPIPPSIRVFSNESALRIRWPKYWSFSFSVSPSNEHPGLISFRMDWLDLLAVQGTLKSLLQQYGSKASVLQRSAFFIVQLSHPYMTTGKTVALTRWTFVGRVLSLLFSVLTPLLPRYLPSGGFQFFSFYIYGLESIMRKDFSSTLLYFIFYFIIIIIIFGHTTRLVGLLVP